MGCCPGEECVAQVGFRRYEFAGTESGKDFVVRSVFGLGFLVFASAAWIASPPVRAAIVVNNDEWTLSDSGFGFAPDAPNFAQNVAALFSGGGPGNFLVYSSNFGLTGSQLASTMASAGHAWTISTALPFTLATFQQYDGLFLAGSDSYPNALEAADLIAYVQGGGSLYIAAGTGNGGAVTEAAAWNQVLNAFGLSLAPSYNGIAGNIAISSPHPLFVGVNSLYQNNGNSIVDLEPANPDNEVLVTLGGDGLYAVWVPEPAPLLLLGVAALIRRRR
ncbi:MAG: hypothetical protein IPM13_15035 [Phycisphaerales bacterium]|nr:hypothetical protein [Phycisphaerales bacterium]